MYKKLLINSVLLSSLFFRPPPCAAGSYKAKQIDSIVIGVYEKGPQIGAQLKLNQSSTILFSFSYIDLSLGEHDVGLSKKIPFNLSHKGGQIEYYSGYMIGTRQCQICVVLHAVFLLCEQTH